MTKTLIKTMTFFSLMTFIVSCDRPVCKNTNTIFDKYSPNAKEFIDELVKQLATVDKSKLTYWMDTYQENNDAKLINVHIQGYGLCAKIVLTINSSDKGIEGIVKNKGMDYRGAELEDLKFNIKQDSTSTEFIFQEISGIVD